MDATLGEGNHLQMAKVQRQRPPGRPRYRRLYISEWIEYLGRKQREVAEAAGVSESHLSLLASGQRPYVQGMVERIADALGIQPGRLFWPPPNAPLWAIVSELNPQEVEQATRILAALKGGGR